MQWRANRIKYKNKLMRILPRFKLQRFAALPQRANKIKNKVQMPSHNSRQEKFPTQNIFQAARVPKQHLMRNYPPCNLLQTHLREEQTALTRVLCRRVSQSFAGERKLSINIRGLYFRIKFLALEYLSH